MLPAMASVQAAAAAMPAMAPAICFSMVFSWVERAPFPCRSQGPVLSRGGYRFCDTVAPNPRHGTVTSLSAHRYTAALIPSPIGLAGPPDADGGRTKGDPYNDDENLAARRGRAWRVARPGHR